MECFESNRSQISQVSPFSSNPDYPDYLVPELFRITISTFRCLNILISCWKKPFFEVNCFNVKYQVSTLCSTQFTQHLCQKISKVIFKNHTVKYALMIKSRLKVQCAEIILKEYKSNYNYLLWIMYYQCAFRAT